MTPTHADLCAALVILGGERFAKDQIRDEEILHLATLGLVWFEDGDWWLTGAGEKLLPDLVDGNEIEPLI